MFFYLLYNSTILEKEIDEYNRSIKVLIYGSIAYIILHKKSTEDDNWKNQLLTYWENEKNRENFGEFSNFVSHWKEQLKCVVE